MFSENIPFIAAEGEKFKELCELLRPGYSPPGRKIVGGRLLDDVYEGVMTETKEKIEGKQFLILTQDGWSSIHNDAVIAHSFSDGKTNYLLNVRDTGANKKTAEFCYTLIDEAITEIKAKFGKDVFAVVTDNEAKMKKMRELVELRHPDIIVYGCSAHYANLLEESVTTADVMKHIVAIHKYFRNVHQAHGLLKELGGCQPQIPNDTRWNSIVDCLQTFLRNHALYVEVKTIMLNKDQDMPANISQSVDNIGLLREAEHMMGHMKKFGGALDKFQADDCNLAESVKVWKGLLNDKVSNTNNANGLINYRNLSVHGIFGGYFSKFSYFYPIIMSLWRKNMEI